MMAAKNHALLLRASTIALALGEMTAVATPAWADGKPECNASTIIGAVNAIPHLRRRILPTSRSPWRISPASFRTSTRRLKILGKGRGRPMAGLRRPWR